MTKFMWRVSNFFNRVYNKLFLSDIRDIWSVGIYEGSNLEELTPWSKSKTPIITAKDVTDIKATFIADPFMIKKHDKWYMFFEIYSEKKNKGVLGVATSLDCYKWRYSKVVLEEDFHLSYPYVFEDNNKMYMIPECEECGHIRIYEAEVFPHKWKLVSNIIDGAYLDPSIVKYNDKYWIFAGGNSICENSLHLFYSDNLTKGWKEHPKSPIICGDSYSFRPGGKIIQYEDSLIRFSQDCSKNYGRKVVGYKIKTITTDDYEEEIMGVIVKNSGVKNTWNKDGMHTVDLHKTENGWLAAVDGYYFRKIKLERRPWILK